MAAGAGTVAGEAFEAYLDGLVPAGEPARLTRIGEGSSNLTYLVERGGARVVLRRPPPPPLPPSAHDVVREARLQLALAEQGVRVPRVLAVCEDPALIGAPFYLMEALDGAVITDAVPAGTDGRALGLAVVDALAELHAVDWRTEALSRFGRPSGYLERQLAPLQRALCRERVAAASPASSALTERLRRGLPAGGDTAVVHGDYRLGNMMVSTGARPELLAILDWEMATVGDPLADLGYLTITWSEPGAVRAPDAAQPGDRRGRLPHARRARRALRRADRAATCRSCPGTRRWRCGSARCSARRSTAATCAASTTTRGRRRCATASRG